MTGENMQYFKEHEPYSEWINDPRYADDPLGGFGPWDDPQPLNTVIDDLQWMFDFNTARNNFNILRDYLKELNGFRHYFDGNTHNITDVTPINNIDLLNSLWNKALDIEGANIGNSLNLMTELFEMRNPQFWEEEDNFNYRVRCLPTNHIYQNYNAQEGTDKIVHFLFGAYYTNKYNKTIAEVAATYWEIGQIVISPHSALSYTDWQAGIMGSDWSENLTEGNSYDGIRNYFNTILSVDKSKIFTNIFLWDDLS